VYTRREDILMRLISSLLLLFFAPLLCAPLLAGDVTLVGSGYTNPTPIQVAPGQVITFFVTGIVATPVKATTLPLPTTLGGISATIDRTLPEQKLPVPLLEVAQVDMCNSGQSASPSNCLITAITAQIPSELVPDNPALVVGNPVFQQGITHITINAPGASASAFLLAPVADNIHVVSNCDEFHSADYGGRPCQSVVAHADGSLVYATRPAAPGEALVVYVVGLGKTDPPMPSGQAAPKAVPVAGPVVLDFEWVPNGIPARPQTGPGYPPLGLAPLFAGSTPGFAGLYQINFVVPTPPAGTPDCLSGFESNLTVRIQGLTSYDGAKLCVTVTPGR
jgi:uncharacterized protein (TIGR03437 family)